MASKGLLNSTLLTFVPTSTYFQVKSYIKSSKKYRVVFFDDKMTTIPISEKNVYPFSKYPLFQVPEAYRENWEKFQKIACTSFGKFLSFKGYPPDIVSYLS